MKTIDLDISVDTTVEFDYLPRQKNTFTGGQHYPGDASEVTNVRVYAYTTLSAIKNALDNAMALGTHHNPLVPIDIFAGLNDTEQEAIDIACRESINETEEW